MGDSGGTAAGTLRLRGVVEEVATGLRATFRNDKELVAALTAVMSAGQPVPSRDGGSRTRRGPSPDSHARS